MPSLEVRKASGEDYAAWRGLFERYLVFYETAPSAERSQRVWNQLLDEADPVECLVAERDGRVIGFVHYLPRHTTWHERQLCYLEDLFVDDASRGTGAGEALIRAVADIALERGWAHVYWETAEDNVRARRLYDKLTGGASGFITYELRPADDAT